MLKGKRVFAATLVAALGLSLAACGDSKDDAAETTESTEAMSSESTEAMAEEEATTTVAGDEEMAEGDKEMAEGLKVGLAFDTGGRGDGTFNDSAATGADKAEADLGIEIVELEAASADDRKPNLETLTSEGANPIVAVGFAFGAGLGEIAAANPDTQYAIVDGFIADAPANVTHLAFAEEQGSFLVGAAAALKCACDKIGFIGGQEIDLIKKFEAGYTAGAKQVNPDIEVEVKYLGAAGDDAAWGSPDKAKDIAAAWFADGVEVVYTAAGGSGNGTIEAATEAGKWAIGVDSDQALTATPEQAAHILTSMLKRVDVAVFDTYKQAAEGTLKGGFNTYDLSVDGVGYSTTGGFLDEFETQLADFKQQIIDGEIKVPTEP